jgi:hypothetical protein
MITPSHIAFGLASADRETLATLLSLFEESDFPALIFDSGRDLVDSVSDWFGDELEKDREKQDRHFEKRILEAREGILKEAVSDSNLRLRLWLHLRNALDLDPDLTFSSSGIENISEPFEKAISNVVLSMNESEEFQKLPFFSTDYWEKRKDKVVDIFKGKQKPSLSLQEVVSQNVLKLLVASGKTDEIPPEVRAKMLQEVKEKISSADAELQKVFLKGGNIEDLSEEAALKLIASGSGLVGVGVAVELAGFSAYIMAAKASAVIPFVGGKTLVSSLAVLSNPLFIIPVLLGGGVLLAGSVKDKILASFAVTAVTTLVLRAVGERNEDADELVSTFKRSTKLIGNSRLQEYMDIKNKGESKEFWDTASSVSRKIASWAKNKIVTDEYPELEKYLDRYYELKGKS